MATHDHNGAAAPTSAPPDSEPVGGRPIFFDADNLYGPVQHEPVLYVREEASLAGLLAAARARVDQLERITEIATCWQAPEPAEVAGVLDLIAPLVRELEAVLAVAAGRVQQAVAIVDRGQA